MRVRCTATAVLIGMTLRHLRCPPKYSTWACSSGPPRAPVSAASFFIENRAEIHEACGSHGPVSWVGLSRPQEVAAPGPRRLGATAQEVQSGAAHPQWQHVGLGCELLRNDPQAPGSKRDSDGTFVVLPLRGAAALDPGPRMRLRRKTFVSQFHEPAETCDARHNGREDVHHEFDRAGALRELLQKEIALLRVQLGPTESAHGFGDTVSCPFCSWLHLKNGKGGLYMHLVRHHGPKGVSYAVALSSCAL